MNFVLDASVAASWIFPDERGPESLLVLDWLDRSIATVPGHWWSEIRNALIIAERRGRLTATETGELGAFLARLAIEADYRPKESDVLALARAHRLTVYDAGYLELALRLAQPLATLDRQLGRAALAEGVKVVGS